MYPKLVSLFVIGGSVDRPKDRWQEPAGPGFECRCLRPLSCDHEGTVHGPPQGPHLEHNDHNSTYTPEDHSEYVLK